MNDYIKLVNQNLFRVLTYLRSQGTILTRRQWQVLQLRAKGLTQAQVAKRLRTTRENVTLLEHRAHDNVKAAKATLATLEHLSKSNEMIIPSGTSIFEATSLILLRGDILRVKLKRNADSLLAMLRSKCKGRIRGHHLTSTISLSIQNDGNITIFRSSVS